ncbi:hypothetical protein HNV11_19820 [Spirosoma taeanense]|uniref:Uncharacterized protein n=1 Tax=Spirosoma taeanense TaxID=2735870 RepID=A0A6M5YDS0_9BACT|nr:hypothetical protein [Spirosoma taeanense]QJW91466.1 hypothetical protein HNV11_19820 [Spirosoma taeanense]
MKKAILSALLTLCTVSVFAQSNESDDVTGVRQACFNYIDTFYKADTTLAYQSIHPSLQKMLWQSPLKSLQSMK